MRRTATCLLLLLSACGTPQPPAAQPGDHAPAFDLASVPGGAAVSSKSLVGEPTLLSFWSLSCAVCKADVEELNALQRGGRVRVVGIAIDGDPEQVAKTMTQWRIEYPILDGDAQVFAAFDGYATPLTVLVDADWKIRKRTLGRIARHELEETVASIEGGP
ncbi:MAG: TlpA family protein disulfide reductase [Thermoanaerobaculia bacterium]|nr:TlpA family protein disulfide reductase [Thermoanaerobaculia bacterium]